MSQAPNDGAHPVLKTLLQLFNETKMRTRNSLPNAAGLTKLRVYAENTRKLGGSEGSACTPLNSDTLRASHRQDER